jgi:hypothetical protein
VEASVLILYISCRYTITIDSIQALRDKPRPRVDSGHICSMSQKTCVRTWWSFEYETMTPPFQSSNTLVSGSSKPGTNIRPSIEVKICVGRKRSSTHGSVMYPVRRCHSSKNKNVIEGDFCRGWVKMQVHTNENVARRTDLYVHKSRVKRRSLSK